MTESATEIATKILGWRGGYTTGYGGYVLQEKPLEKGDWNNRSSRWHY